MGKKARCSSEGRLRNGSRAFPTADHQLPLVLGVLILMLSIGLTGKSAFAQDSGESPSGLPGPADVIGAIEAGQSHAVSLAPTDAEAAENRPLQDLGRDEAIELLQGVFEAQLQAPAGIFDELEVERFLAPDVAVIAGDGSPTQVSSTQADASPGDGEQTESSEPMTEKEELRAQAPPASEDPHAGGSPTEEGLGELNGATLLDSSIPLRAESPSGDPEAVDLSLQHSEGGIQPINPLVEVGIPQELGDGIELPGPGVTIELANAPEDRVVSVIDQSVGFLPNVAEDTDFVIAPTPTGVETLTQLRSADSPHSQTFNLDLPPGATLQATENGGAAVVAGEETLLTVSRPTAIDAAGAKVPVSMDVAGNSLILDVSPDQSAQLPILVDPLFQTYEWANAKSWESGICSNGTKYEGPSFSCTNREEWGYDWVENDGSLPFGVHVSNQAYSAADPVPYGTTGIVLDSSRNSSGMLTAGDRGSTIYTVPRYFTDQTKYGSRPTSFISHMTLWNLDWNAWSSSMSPYLFAGIWDPFKPGWVSYYSHEGLSGHSVHDMSWKYQFNNSAPNTNAKVGYVSIQATSTGPSQNTEAYVGSASLELNDKDIPGFGSIAGPSQWVNQTALPISFTASDSGLGMYAFTVTEGVETEGNFHSWKTLHGCKGVSGAACPRTWQSTDAGTPALKYEPAVMPQGIDYLTVVAEDPVGNKSAVASVQVKVDHTAPALALSGTMTEQATLGTKHPSYTLKVDATDGTPEQPQSGVAKASIEFDGKVVATTEPGCSTKNCAIPIEMSIESSKFAAGQHTVKINATDAVDLTTTKTLTIELQPSPPSLSLSGSMTEQTSLGTSRPRYKLKVDATAQAGLEGSPPAPTFNSSFGSAGTGNGQFAHPGDVALDAKGNLWVVDENNNRVEQFNEKGEYVTKFGMTGSGNGQLKRPTSLAIDAKGNIWVADAGNNRLEQFNEKGEFLKAVGAYGAGNGQFSGPEGIAIDPKGNIWVSDTYNARLQQFNENGEFLKVVGTEGSATGQLVEPTGIDVGPGGNVWVADWANNRVEVYNEAGEYVRQFGSEGTGNGQFMQPDALAIDTKGNVWVGDQNNDRVQQFNQSGEYVAQFGEAGSGEGQFSFGYPMGIETDPAGNIWVTDTGNNRVQKWQVPGYSPAYLSSFGSVGSGDGQFNHPSDAAVDPDGNLWVVDRFNSRVQKFSPKGEYLGQFGSNGSGNGQFNWPSAIDIDSEGNLLVADSANHRVQKFNAKGEYMSQFGSYGSGNGQFNGPAGIAAGPNGWIYVTDRGNHRIEAFGKNGVYLGQKGSYGWEDAQFDEPTGVVIGGPYEGKAFTVVVVDGGNNRVQRFGPLGGFLGKFGSFGSGAGQLSSPASANADSAGNIWIGDRSNGRVVGFNQYGEYLGKFGTPGVQPGQFSFVYPMGIVGNPHGTLWVTDAGNNRIQRWSQANWRSEITTEVTVDGKSVNTGEAGCTTEQCPVAREWTLDSATSSVGKHTVLATATDGLGNKTSKSLTIEVQPDTAKPTLESGGELVEAPEGWVEQESYGLNASATDSDYGVTSLAFKIDGQQVASASQGCADGGCSETLSKSIDMSAYSGGAHPAELIATDGAGNPTTQHWTINVDPEGHITASEAEDTLEAADATSESTVVAPTDQVLEPEQIEGGDNPGLKQSGSEIVSTGVPDTTTMTTDPEDGFTIHSPGATTTITPIVSENSSAISIAEGVAGVAANTGDEVDSIIRPEYNGVQTFQAIRSATSPETYSWKVHLTEGQALHYVNSSQAEVVNDDGKTAFLITAENAHDATGALVPTSLQVNGDVLTLKVEIHSGTFVYPIVAGQGWEGGYRVPVIVEGPEDEAEIKQREQEERERAEREALEGGEGPPPPAPQPPLTQAQAAWLVKAAVERNSDIEAPPYPTGGGATASTTRHFTVHEQHVCHVDHCAIWKVWIAGGSEAEHPHFIRGFNWSEWANGTAVHCGWHFDTVYAATGLSITEEGCSFAGSWKVWKGEGKHLTIWTRHAITALVVTPEVQFTETKHLALLVWVWPNGFQQKVVRDYDPGIAEN